MSVTVRIPTVLRNYTAGKETITVEAVTVDQAHPGLKGRLCDDAGRLRRHVNVFVGEEDIRFLEGQATVLKAGDQLDIVPAIA